ncbi:MAG: hypothetical protein IIV74_00705 [Alphaproteobacteria bacterium]|nr:hypothetical protein [Alphaproteobacteria bacterium]
MAKDSAKYTISQVYDIAKTIINDKTIKGSKSHNSYSTNYIFKKDDLFLKIYAPHGGREWDGDYDKWDYNTGYIQITDEHGTLFAETKYNVGRAMTRSRLNPISILTRLRAPLFFHLIDLAEKRDLDQKETIEYKIATLRMKTR